MKFTSRQYAFENPFVVVAMVVCIAAVGFAYWFDEEARSDAGTGTAVTLALAVVALVAIVFITVSQTVTDTHVKARVAGVFTRDIPLRDIQGVEVRDYRPIRQFGGWGVRWGANGSRAYTMTGTRAVVLTLTDGRDVYLSARDPEQLAEAIGRARAVAGER